MLMILKSTYLFTCLKRNVAALKNSFRMEQYSLSERFNGKSFFNHMHHIHYVKGFLQNNLQHVQILFTLIMFMT